MLSEKSGTMLPPQAATLLIISRQWQWFHQWQRVR